MKVLYINRPNSDYLQDIIYTGLVKLIGAQNIIEYPWNIRFHLNHRPYPKNLGQVKGEFFNSLKAKLSPHDYDIVIVASCHPDTIQYYSQIIKEIPPHVKTIFIDGGDMPEIAGDLSITKGNGKELYNELMSYRKFDYIFKREYLLDAQYDKNVYSLPFGFNLDHLPNNLNQKYKYDVAFWAVESDPIRTKVLELLEDKYDCKENGTTRNQVMKKYKRKGKFYLEELSACKIGLNFRGGGWDTLRFWEIPALGGFMISQKLNIQIDHNFTDGKNIIYCENDLSNLTELCDYYLTHEEKRINIAHNAKKHIEEFHTDMHRAKKILDTITV